jgi:hypothetical protein
MKECQRVTSVAVIAESYRLVFLCQLPAGVPLVGLA